MVVYAYYPLGETRVQREAEALVSHGFEVDVICLRDKASEAAQEDVNGVHVYRLPIERLKRDSFAKLFWDYLVFFIVAMFAVSRLHVTKRYQVIQIHNLPDFLVFCAWLPKLMGAAIILDLHDLMPEFYTSRGGRDKNSRGARLVMWQEKVSCRFADHVITVTELWRQTLIARGVPAEKVSVVMNVADDRIFCGQAAHKGVSNGHFKLVYHGLQVQRYGLDLVLQAIARLRTEIPNIQFLLHGNGEYHRTLQRMATELNVDELVAFSKHFVDVSELPILISKADIGVVPYRRDNFTDGILPTKLMEYVAVGLPVIASRTPVIETYFDETMVEFFTADNVDELVACIRKLYRDPVRRAALVQNANRFNEQYNWTKLGGEYAALVERLGQRH